MVLTLLRKWKKADYTIGIMYVDGRQFCNTLEPPVRSLGEHGEGKIKGNTAIPAGEYSVVMRYSNKYGKPMPRLLNVPFFDGILIHPGNTVKDTQGCILVGRNRAVGKVLDSRKTFAELIEIITKAEKGLKIVIE